MTLPVREALVPRAKRPNMFAAVDAARDGNMRNPAPLATAKLNFLEILAIRASRQCIDGYLNTAGYQMNDCL